MTAAELRVWVRSNPVEAPNSGVGGGPVSGVSDGTGGQRLGFHFK